MQSRLLRNACIVRACNRYSFFRQVATSRCLANGNNFHDLRVGLCGSSALDTSSVKYWGSYRMTPQKMRDLCDIGLDRNRRLAHARFLRHELCIRLAHAVIGLWSLPHALARREGINEAIVRHIEAISDLEKNPCPRTVAQEEKFTNMLKDIYMALDEIVGLVIQDVHNLAAEFGDRYKTVQPQVDSALEHFFHWRIGLRVLLKQHIESQGCCRPGFSGVMQLRGKLADIAHTAAQEAAGVCKAHTGLAPPIFVVEHGEGSMSASPICMPAVISYVLREVFKNACRAVVEHHGYRDGNPLPPVQCHIMNGKTALLIKISDMGGGISPTDMEKVGRFAHSTSKRRGELAGYGAGIALSRLYARYLGGDLSLSSKVGIGTDVALRTPWLGAHQERLLTAVFEPEHAVGAPKLTLAAYCANDGLASTSLQSMAV